MPGSPVGVDPPATGEPGWLLTVASEGYDEPRPGNPMPMRRGHVLTKIDLQLASIRAEIDEIEAATVEDDALTADEKDDRWAGPQSCLGWNRRSPGDPRRHETVMRR
jgi:hypothetical protein